MGKNYRENIGFKIAGLLAVGVLVFPVAGAAAANDTANANLTANLGSTITIAASNPTSIDVTPTPAGSQSSANGTVTVSTNNSGGYNLAISATTTTLNSGSATLPASSATASSPAILSNNTWGYRIDNEAGFSTGDSSTPLDNVASSPLTYAGVTTSPVVLKTTSAPVASDITNVSYSLKADSNQQSGAYTGQVTYTAATNN